MFDHDVAYGSPEDIAQHAEYFKYMCDWQVYDFYNYNPINDRTKSMDYQQYREGRANGTIPTPDRAKVQYAINHPMHIQQEDGI